MAIINFGNKTFYRNPWNEFERIRREMELLARNAGDDDSGQRKSSIFPPLNISEETDNIIVRAEIPGVNTENLEIFIEGETLNIKGERKKLVDLEKNVSYHRRELEYGSFNRAITLPTRVKVEEITATNENGILHLTLPKAEEVKPKKITVSVG